MQTRSLWTGEMEMSIYWVWLICTLVYCGSPLNTFCSDWQWVHPPPPFPTPGCPFTLPSPTTPLPPPTHPSSPLIVCAQIPVLLLLLLTLSSSASFTVFTLTWSITCPRQTKWLEDDSFVARCSSARRAAVEQLHSWCSWIFFSFFKLIPGLFLSYPTVIHLTRASWDCFKLGATKKETDNPDRHLTTERGLFAVKLPSLLVWKQTLNFYYFRSQAASEHIQASVTISSLLLLCQKKKKKKMHSCRSPLRPHIATLANSYIIIFFKAFFFCMSTDFIAYRLCSRWPTLCRQLLALQGCSCASDSDGEAETRGEEIQPAGLSEKKRMERTLLPQVVHCATSVSGTVAQNLNWAINMENGNNSTGKNTSQIKPKRSDEFTDQ